MPKLPAACLAAVIGLGGALLAGACHGDSTQPDTPPTTGSIRVVVSMTGTDLPSRNVVSSNGRYVNPGADGVGVLTKIPPGTQLVSLQVPVNCRVDGDNPRSVEVTAGQTANISFSMTCQATTGTLRIVASTTGVDLDPNGFAVDVNGFSITGVRYRRTSGIGPNETLVFSPVAAGNNSVVISGFALNCGLEDDAVRTVVVEPAKEATVTFVVHCSTAGQIAFTKTSAAGPGIYVVKENGTDARRISPEHSSDDDVAWSPDGARIAFTSVRDGNREIYVADADGSNALRLTNALEPDYQPSWSPDGRRLAFISERMGSTPEIFVMNADGTNLVRLTTNLFRESDPAWSPDGQRIAFTSQRDANTTEVIIMNADGTSPTRVPIDRAKQPAWSRDGRLAFAAPHCDDPFYGCYPAIWIKAGDAQPVAVLWAIGEKPSWSPDGHKLVYVGADCSFYYAQCLVAGIRVARVDADEVVEVTSGWNPVWRP